MVGYVSASERNEAGFGNLGSDNMEEDSCCLAGDTGRILFPFGTFVRREAACGRRFGQPGSLGTTGWEQALGSDEARAIGLFARVLSRRTPARLRRASWDHLVERCHRQDDPHFRQGV